MATAQELGFALTTPPAAAAGRTLGPPPPRRAHSLRRTASQQSHWPEGLGPRYEMICRARDLYTGADLASPVEIGAEWITAQVRHDAVVEVLSASRRNDELAALAGRRVGGPLRKGVAEIMPEEPEGSTLLYRMIDDMAGGAFLSPASWQSWLEQGIDAYAEAIGAESIMERSMEGMCISYARGSPALHPDGRQNQELAYRSVGLLAVDPDEPHAWHDLLSFDGPNQARLRYMEVWREAGAIRVMFGFQDSSAFPGTEMRRLFHEYRGLATADPDSFELLDIAVDFGSLPYTTCQISVQSPARLVGRDLRAFRQTVLEVLPGTAGCTHLNDSLRTLQDIPALARALDRCLAET